MLDFFNYSGVDFTTVDSCKLFKIVYITHMIPTSPEGMNWHKVWIILHVTELAKLCGFVKIVLQLNACLDNLCTQISFVE